MPEPRMDAIKTPSNFVTSTPRKGCDPIMATQRGKMQSQRLLVNQRLCKEMRLRNGAENLFNATTNPKVKETVSLELSFVNSNLQLLKEELNDINSHVDAYQNKSGKAVSIPMLPLGLKETQELDFFQSFENIILNHYGEDPSVYSEELADFADLRTSIRTPARTIDGVTLLFDYYNQLASVASRFFPPTKPLGVYFHWYDAVSGVPAVQRSIYFEKASVLFNIGALYSQIGTRGDRSKSNGIKSAIDSFQRSAGIFCYIRNNFTNAPTMDMSRGFLTALMILMLAQAEECELELKMLGGFEIELGKCVSIAQAAMKELLRSWFPATDRAPPRTMFYRREGYLRIATSLRYCVNEQIYLRQGATVAEKYSRAEKAFHLDSIKFYTPYSWVNMIQVKVHHYRALSHYYAGLGLLEQHELAEPIEITKLLSSLYNDSLDSDIPKPEDVARRKENRKRLGRSHLRHAVFCHEQALQTHSLCKMHRDTDVLKEYLQHDHQRSVSKFSEVNTEEDFFELVEAPTIQGHSTSELELITPSFGKNASKDLFRKLGPISVFSINCQFGPKRVITLTNQDTAGGISFHGDSPVTITNIEEKSKFCGLMIDDVILSIDGVDAKWFNYKQVIDVIDAKNGSSVVLEVTNAKRIVTNESISSAVDSNEMMMVMNGNSLTLIDDDDSTNESMVTRRSQKNKKDVKNRHSLGIFHGLKIRAQPNRHPTVAENAATDLHTPPVKKSISLQRNSTTSKNFLSSLAALKPKTNNMLNGKRSDC